MRVEALNLHPVKSTAIRPVGAAEVGRAGLAGDREWMVVGDDGDLVSARTLPELFRVVADCRATGVDADLRLSHPSLDALELRFPQTGEQRLTLFGSKEILGRPAGPEADEWLRRATGREDLHLVWCHRPEARALGAAYGRPGEYTACADSCPVTLLNRASLRQLDQWLAETASERGDPAPKPLAEQRFRANIVVDGDGLAPFAEDGWKRLRIGGALFRVAKPVGRCVMTTIDPATLERAKEPIRTLARHRRGGEGVEFCIHLIPEQLGSIGLGDEAEVVEQ